MRHKLMVCRGERSEPAAVVSRHRFPGGKELNCLHVGANISGCQAVFSSHLCIKEPAILILCGATISGTSKERLRNTNIALTSCLTNSGALRNARPWKT